MFNLKPGLKMKSSGSRWVHLDRVWFYSDIVFNVKSGLNLK